MLASIYQTTNDNTEENVAESEINDLEKELFSRN